MTKQLYALHALMKQSVKKGLKVKGTIGVIKPKRTWQIFYIAPHFTAAPHLHRNYHITPPIRADATYYVVNTLMGIQQDCLDIIDALKIPLAIIVIFGLFTFF